MMGSHFPGFIHNQVDGFFRAGRRVVRPKNVFETKISRGISYLLILFSLLIFILFAAGRDHIPLRIHLRALTLMAPMAVLVVMFYRGISLSWMAGGLAKYWLMSALLLYMGIVVLQMLYSAFLSGSIGIVGYSGGILMLLISVVFGCYFYFRGWKIKGGRKLGQLGASQKISLLANYLIALLFVPLFAGGLAMLAWASGLDEWFFSDVLGW